MRLILDTHYVIWLTDSPERLNPAERVLIFAAGNDIAVSAASIWEVRIKWSARFKSGERSGQRKIDTDPAEALRTANKAAMRLLPISAELAAISLTDPIAHRDPFDELLLIQAQHDGWRLLTRDELLTGHPLALVV